MQKNRLFLLLIMFPSFVVPMQRRVLKKQYGELLYVLLRPYCTTTKSCDDAKCIQKIQSKIAMVQSAREFWFKLGDSLGRSLSTPMSIFVSAGLGFQSLTYTSAAFIAAAALTPTFACLTRAIHLFKKEQELEQKVIQLEAIQTET